MGAETAHGCYRPILTDDPGNGHLLPASLEVGTSGYLDSFTSLWTLINSYSFRWWSRAPLTAVKTLGRWVAPRSQLRPGDAAEVLERAPICPAVTPSCAVSWLSVNDVPSEQPRVVGACCRESLCVMGATTSFAPTLWPLPPAYGRSRPVDRSQGGEPLWFPETQSNSQGISPAAPSQADSLPSQPRGSHGHTASRLPARGRPRTLQC